MTDRPYSAGSDTSWLAAHSIPAGRLSSLKTRVLSLLRDSYPAGLSDHDLAQAMDEWIYTVAPRRKWLVDAGLVKKGNRKMGPRRRYVSTWVYIPEARFKEFRKKRYRVPATQQEVVRARRALKAIDRLHVPEQRSFVSDWGKEVAVDGPCVTCGSMWPCETAKILNQARSTGNE